MKGTLLGISAWFALATFVHAVPLAARADRHWWRPLAASGRKHSCSKSKTTAVNSGELETPKKGLYFGLG